MVAPDNYVVMVPSYIVFDNMLRDFIKSLNITTDITVIYDQKYRIELNWRRLFLNYFRGSDGVRMA